MKARITLAIILLTSFSICNSQPIEQRIDKLIEGESINNNFSGCALVASKSEIILNKGYGASIIDLKNNVPETRFRIGSLTKGFTSVIILKLVESGKLSLKDKLGDYITGYPEESSDKILIEHLLSHTSGIPDYTRLPELMNFINTEHSRQDFIKIFSEKDLLFEPGTDFSYSNSGYYLLGMIIEEVTGKSYEDNLQSLIFDPLGMMNSGYINNNIKHEMDANGYIKSAEGYKIPMTFHHSIPFSAGGIYSTTEDLYKFYMNLIQGKIISKKGTEMLFTPFIADADNKYGFGFGILGLENNDSENPIEVIGHEGSIPGFMSLIHIVNREYFIVLLDNNENRSLLNIANQIRELILLN